MRQPKKNTKKPKSRIFHSHLYHGYPQPEMFAWKSMDSSYELLKLKLTMVYKNIPMEEIETKFKELTAPLAPPSSTEIPNIQ